MERLHGANQIHQFKKVADSLESKIASCEGVAGIAFMGGLVRGFADKYSDVDIIVLLSRKDESLRKAIREMASDEQKRSSVDVDLEVHFLEDFKNKKWNEMARWDFSHAKIVHDSQGETRRLFRDKLKVPEIFWKKRVVIYGEYVKWYCCPPGKNADSIVGSWEERGDVTSAHYCLDYALHLMIRIVFALNKQFMPPPKWAIFYSQRLKWLPLNYKKLVREALTVKSLSKRDLQRRSKAVKELWKEILPKIRKETGLTPESISRQYVNHVLQQG